MAVKRQNLWTMPELFKIHGAIKAFARHVRPKKEGEKTFEKRSSAAQGYGYRWQKLREWFLKKNPLCVECLKKNVVTPATEVDHIVPHKGDKKLFWAISNLQALCAKCHSRKTAREDGGFGNYQYKEVK